MMNESNDELAVRLAGHSDILPEPLRTLDTGVVYRILLLDSTGRDIPPDLADSPEMFALEAEGLMHEIIRESHHVGISIEQSHGYRGDAKSTALLNAMRAAIGEEPVVRAR